MKEAMLMGGGGEGSQHLYTLAFYYATRNSFQCILRLFSCFLESYNPLFD